MTRNNIHAKLHKPGTPQIPITTQPETKKLTIQVQSSHLRQKIQYTNPEDTIKLLSTSDITHVRQVIVKILYYKTAVNNTMLVTLGDLASTKKNREDDGRNNTPPQLRINPPKHKYAIPKERNDTPHTQKWIIYISTQITHLRQRTLLPIRKNHLPLKLKT